MSGPNHVGGREEVDCGAAENLHEMVGIFSLWIVVFWLINDEP
jgi:hypothetical protein